MTGTEILQEVISIMIGGIQGVAEGIGSGLTTLAKSIFLTTTGTGSDAVTTISTFGVLVIVFAGISLAIGLSRWVVNFVCSLGQRNR